MDKSEYSFKKLKKDLDDGFGIYFNYLNSRFLVYKTNNNCYTQEMIESYEKSPHPRLSMITLKRLKEIYISMEEIEYKI